MTFRLSLFGGLSLEGPDGPVTGRAAQRRRLALMALLAPARARGLTRDHLVACLWPDADPERARRLLSDSVYRVNEALGGDGILSAGERLRLNPEVLSCDAWDFLDAVESGDWARAAAFGDEPFLNGFFLPDSGEFERWADTEREGFRRMRAGALEALARQATERGDHAAAVRWWRALATDDPYSSRVALELMRSLDRAGDRPAAIRHAQVHSAVVRDELDVEPDEQVLELAAALRSSRPTTRDRGERRSTEVEGADTDPLESAASSESAGIEPARAHRDAPGTHRWSRHVAASIAILALGAMAWLLVAGPTPPPPTAIAVLPFEDLDPDGLQEYFAHGITEELLVRLSRVDGVKVVGRTSSLRLSGGDLDLEEIASRLGVDAVLSGSVLKSGERLRIFARLVDASTGYQLWSERYERTERDVFDIQDEIAAAIVGRLRGEPEEGGADAVAVYATTDDLEAYNLYLRGRFEWHKRSEAGLRSAVRYFRDATERAPDYARAFAGLGDAYAVLGFYDHLPPGEAFPAAIEAARRALELDPTLAEARATLGYAALYYTWDWAGAEAEFRRTLELDPGYSTGHQWYSNFLTAMGAYDAAVRAMRTAQALDPLSLIANAALGWVLFHARDFEEAIEQLDRTLELDPSFEVAIVWRALSYAQLGRFDQALPAARRAADVSGSSSTNLAVLARTHALAGDEAAARRVLQRIEDRAAQGAYVPSYEVATVYEALGDVPSALDWLERAYEERSHSLVFLVADPRLDRIRGEPRYRTLVREVGLDRR